jgi:hypothetical protein
VDLASAITLTGQAVIQNNENIVNAYGLKIGQSGEPAIKVIAGDTDSVVGSSIIVVDGIEMTIAEYHDSLSQDIAIYEEGGEIRLGRGSAMAFDGTNVVHGRILCSMRHKVKKKLYRIWVDDKFVDVTENHSVIVVDELGNILEKKPTELGGYSMGIMHWVDEEFMKTHIHKVELLGEVDDYVYDIEVDGVHNFFANDILVHNSNYIDMTNLMKNVSKDIPKEKQVDILDKFCQGKLAQVIAGGMDEITKDTNGMKQRLYMKREAISTGIIVAKKRFVFEVFDMEGVRYATPDQKVTGLESQRSSTPKWCRDKLKDAYKIFFSGDEKTFQAFCKKVESDYMNEELSLLTAASSANNLTQYIIDGVPTKGTPYHLKGACAYNNMIQSKKLTGKYQLIKSGDKIKVAALVTPNPTKAECIAFSDKIPPEFGIEQFVDRHAMFAKFFKEPLQRVADVVGWSTERRFVL